MAALISFEFFNIEVISLSNVTRMVKWLAYGVVIVSGSVYVWNRKGKLLRYTVIGPYRSSVAAAPMRALQRAVIDVTKKDVRTEWYPLNSLTEVAPTRISDNGHPVSGAVRDAARRLITSALDAAGARKFEISPSGRTLDDEHCAHQHYAVGDLAMGVRDDKPKPGEIIVGIDVDYYFRDPDAFLGNPNAAIFHTFQPLLVAGIDGDSPYRIIDNNVHYDVSGGSNWTHKVWDWCVAGEYIEFNSPMRWWQYPLALIGLQKTLYHKVHHARPWVDCPHRALVWCIPQFTIWRFKWIPTDLHVRRLKHTIFQDESRPGWNALVRLRKNDELWISIGREGEDAQVDLKKVDFDILTAMKTAQAVTSKMIAMTYKSPQDMALMSQYFEKKVSDDPNACRIMRPTGVVVHWPAPIEADAKETSARNYGNPVVTDQNMIPMIKRWEVLSMSLERRVACVRNDRVPSKRVQRFAEEYIRHVVPRAGEGVPYSIEETIDKLDKPSQVLAIKQVMETLEQDPRELIEAFAKNEPTMKCTRIISSFPDVRFLVRLSRYTLCCRDEILHAEHNEHWFCPGLTPREIAAKVQEFCGSVAYPAETDFSNLDGTVSRWMQRHVMNAIYMRYFNHQFHADLAPFLDSLITCPSRAKRFNFYYDSGVGVKSGSPTTCDLNTVASGFVEYCAIRMAVPELDPGYAFRLIGLKFGDDGLNDRRYNKYINKVAIDLGLEVKIEDYAPDKGVTFLARVFPDPVNSLTSFQDPLRTWRKLHLTTRDPSVPEASAALDRVEGYLVTDALSPVTSNYAQMIQRAYTPIAEDLAKRMKRKSCDKEKPFWLTQGGAWPQEPKDSEMMLACAAARTGFTIEQLRAYCSHLDSITDPWAAESLNRGELPNPYKDTLDEDAQPVEGPVDIRQFTADQDVQRARADPAIARASQSPDDGGYGSDSEPRPQCRSSREQRPGELQVVPARSAGKGVSRHRQPTRKTTGNRGSKGGGGSPRRDRPKSSAREVDSAAVPAASVIKSGAKRGDHRRGGRKEGQPKRPAERIL